MSESSTNNVNNYTYDLNGNLINIHRLTNNNLTSTETMQYDSLGRQLTWTDGTNTETSVYSGSAWHRHSLSYSGNTTYFMYDGDNVVMDIVNNTVNRFYVTNGIDSNLSMYDNNSNECYWYSHDGLGSVRTVTDINGAIVSMYDYTAFGEKFEPTMVTNTITQRYSYTGREDQPHSKQMYYRFRNYSPSIGRFIHRDPIGYEGGINLYTYVFSNPLFSIDPYGLDNYVVSGITPSFNPIKHGNEKGIKSFIPFTKAVPSDSLRMAGNYYFGKDNFESYGSHSTIIRVAFNQGHDTEKMAEPMAARMKNDKDPKTIILTHSQGAAIATEALRQVAECQKDDCKQRTVNLVLGSPVSFTGPDEIINKFKDIGDIAWCWKINVLITTHPKDSILGQRSGKDLLEYDFSKAGLPENVKISAYNAPHGARVNNKKSHSSENAMAVNPKKGNLINNPEGRRLNNAINRFIAQ